jgi:glyoxylase-like metal-dependent hydrolase (beta-lactamase superfamily II)
VVPQRSRRTLDPGRFAKTGAPPCGKSDIVFEHGPNTHRTPVRYAAVPVVFRIAYTQNQGKQAPQLTINKVKDDLYNIEGDGGNVAVLVTSEGVILVDDKFDRDHDAIVANIKSVTNQPVKYVLSTHHHADHSGGNAMFLPTAEIISTANARTNILEHKQSNAPPGVAPARLVFTQETAVFLGGKEARARHYGRGHTNGDAIIYFPALRTIHTGDLMAGTSPLIDYPGGGSVVEWTKTLDAAMKLDFDTVIPGHGKVTNKAGLLAYRDNVEKLRNRVSGLIREGKGQDDVGKVVMAEYGWAAGSLNMQWSLPGMMTELK